MKKINRIILGCLSFALGLFLVVGNETFADDWAPQLYPQESFDADEEENYEPARVQRPSRKAKRLAAPSSRHVTFDQQLEPQQRILPTRFLEEDTATSGYGSKPAKNRKPKAVETGEVTATPDETYYGGEEHVTDGGIYYVDEYSGNLVASGMMFGGTPLMAEAANAQAGGGLYNEFSPVQGGEYVGYPVMKSFGTGILDNLTFFGGVTGFKSELDAGRGSFGFSEGFNWSGPATPQCTFSAQFGLRAVQADLSGSQDVNKSFREQYFITAGIFKRFETYPFQIGIAYDWCKDDFYDRIELGQVRCEVSFRTFTNLEYGFQGGFGTTKKSNDYINARENFWYKTNDVEYKIRSDNYFLGFGRKHLSNGAVLEARLGGTENGDVILAAMGELPINDQLTVNGGFTGMISKDSRNDHGWRREHWALSVGVVFYFRGGACTKPCNPCRPMFDVADNGTFMPLIKK